MWPISMGGHSPPMYRRQSWRRACFQQASWARAQSPLKRACRQDCRRYQHISRARLKIGPQDGILPHQESRSLLPGASVCNTWYNNQRSSLYLGGFILQASFYVALFLSFASAAGAGDSAFEATAIIDDYVAASKAQ